MRDPQDGRQLDLNDIRCRAAVYRLLARIWRRELDEQTLAELASGPLRDAFRAAGGSPPETTEAGELDALAIDYCRVFLGPASHLPPYQSVWSEGQFQGAAVASLQRYVELFPAGRWDSVAMLDHLGIELEIMACLLEQLTSVSAWPDEPSEEFETAMLEIARSFFRDHLSWPQPLCAAVRQRAQTAFYRTMAEMTDGFLATERQTWRLSPGKVADISPT